MARTTKRTTAKRKTAKRTSTRKKTSATKKTKKKTTAKKATKKKTAPTKRAATTKTRAKVSPRKKTAAKKVAPKEATTSKKKVSAKAAKKVAKIIDGRRRFVVEKPEAAPKKRRTKSPYTRTQLRPMRRQLLKHRLRVAGDLDLMGDEALRAGEADIDDDSVADHGSDAFERDMTLGLMENETKLLQQIDTALALMESGLYGLCEICNEPIPLPRLEALPFARTCVPCQEKAERF